MAGLFQDRIGTMIQGIHPIWQALLASLFTWGVTALGAAVVFVLHPHSKKVLDVSLGFAAGVMTAASFWSLLAPAIEIAESKVGVWAFLPVAIGFALGAAFVFGADHLMPSCGFTDASVVEMMRKGIIPQRDTEVELTAKEEEGSVEVADALRRRRRGGHSRTLDESGVDHRSVGSSEHELAVSWRRIFLLIVAVTVHNIPEGLAVGVGFGSIGKTESATFRTAFNLALGIGLQNFPEGLAVSLPLAGFGYSKMLAFWYGQLSGMVEPIAALAGASAVIVSEPILPYALAFAAGAMIYVVVDDIIPEAQRNGNGKLASFGAIVGFIVMMCLDVGLG
uniref:Zinc transporter ZIP11 n=1 Tax=Plectus sambesii TaxID=2011161 RepID=A0A914WVJ1_9BILA